MQVTQVWEMVAEENCMIGLQRKQLCFESTFLSPACFGLSSGWGQLPFRGGGVAHDKECQVPSRCLC
jgi:hypothetical protein